MITFEVQEQDFVYWLRSVEHSFVTMIETMIRVAEVVKEKTQPITPLETGRLSRSFRWHILTDNSRMKVLQIEMTALNPRTGYDYAWIQHEANYNHNAIELGFHNYRRSYVDESGWATRPSSGWRSLEYNHGDRRYLFWGIRYSENTAFEMIETDYLSLFTREFIY